MSDPLPVERREIIEERGNRDARYIALALCAVLFAFAVAAAIAAWRLHVVLMPLVPRELPKLSTPSAQQPEQKRILRTVEGAPRPPFGGVSFPALSRTASAAPAACAATMNPARAGVIAGARGQISRA